MLKMTKLVGLSHTDPDGCIVETVKKRAVGNTFALPFPKFEESLLTSLSFLCSLCSPGVVMVGGRKGGFVQC